MRSHQESLDFVNNGLALLATFQASWPSRLSANQLESLFSQLVLWVHLHMTLFLDDGPLLCRVQVAASRIVEQRCPSSAWSSWFVPLGASAPYSFDDLVRPIGVSPLMPPRPRTWGIICPASPVSPLPLASRFHEPEAGPSHQAGVLPSLSAQPAPRGLPLHTILQNRLRAPANPNLFRSLGQFAIRTGPTSPMSISGSSSRSRAHSKSRSRSPPQWRPRFSGSSDEDPNDWVSPDKKGKSRASVSPDPVASSSSARIPPPQWEPPKPEAVCSSCTVLRSGMMEVACSFTNWGTSCLPCQDRGRTRCSFVTPPWTAGEPVTGLRHSRPYHLSRLREQLDRLEEWSKESLLRAEAAAHDTEEAECQSDIFYRMLMMTYHELPRVIGDFTPRDILYTFLRREPSDHELETMDLQLLELFSSLVNQLQP
ncbi:hypothetical protein M413DRAFT_28263 [Hebeloma cylindrosporum]|uniref:Uncharacterized protein n=1 Tax=Hebeloma cylindrosporum TaxID=76867 RepID=A0A0C3CA09_HEBCY|nr:hypothetical protein M413DRAFT_28263 [Hebeloma cylindrosporum h7]